GDVEGQPVIVLDEVGIGVKRQPEFAGKGARGLDGAGHRRAVQALKCRGARPGQMIDEVLRLRDALHRQLWICGTFSLPSLRMCMANQGDLHGLYNSRGSGSSSMAVKQPTRLRVLCQRWGIERETIYSGVFLAPANTVYGAKT